MAEQQDAQQDPQQDPQDVKRDDEPGGAPAASPPDQAPQAPPERPAPEEGEEKKKSAAGPTPPKPPKPAKSKSVAAAEEVRRVAVDEAPAQPEGQDQVIATEEDLKAVQVALLEGDFARLTPQQKLYIYFKRCQGEGVDPYLEPYSFGVVNKKLKLIPNKSKFQQQRIAHGIEWLEKIPGTEEPNPRIELVDDARGMKVLAITLWARTKDGRVDFEIGMVALGNLAGEDYANRYMSCFTKVKNRLTSSLAGGAPEPSDVEVEGITGALARAGESAPSDQPRQAVPAPLTRVVRVPANPDMRAGAPPSAGLLAAAPEIVDGELVAGQPISSPVTVQAPAAVKPSPAPVPVPVQARPSPGPVPAPAPAPRAPTPVATPGNVSPRAVVTPGAPERPAAGTGTPAPAAGPPRATPGPSAGPHATPAPRPPVEARPAPASRGPVGLTPGAKK